MLARVTDPPSLEDFMGDPPEPQSEDEMMFELQKWAALTKGATDA